MKRRAEKLEQFFSGLARRKEYVLTKEKNIGKIDLEQTWYSEQFSEEVCWLSFPIEVEILVIRTYEDDQRMEASITRIQNGKRVTILELGGYFDELSDNEYGEFFEKFDRCIENFRRKGFVEIA